MIERKREAESERKTEVESEIEKDRKIWSKKYSHLLNRGGNTRNIFTP